MLFFWLSGLLLFIFLVFITKLVFIKIWERIVSESGCVNSDISIELVSLCIHRSLKGWQ